MAAFSDLVVKLELQQAAFQKGMDQAARSMARVQSGAKGAQSGLKGLESAMSGVAQAAAAVGTAFAAVKGLEAIVKAADQVRNLQGSFTALLGDAGRAGDMLQRVFGIVERTGAPLEAVGGAATRLTIALRDLGASNRQIESITETFLQLGKVGGASAAETAASLQQLGQALASGKLGGDELRSIRENAPLVADAIAKSMGVTSGALKQLGEDGKLSADVVANALLKAAGSAAAAFAQMPVSFEQALNKMESQAIQAAASFDKISGITQTLVTTVDSVAAGLKRWNDELSQTNKNLNATQLVAELVGDVVRLTAAAFVAMGFAVETVVKRLGFIGEQIQLILDGDWSGLITSSNRFRNEMEAAARATEQTLRALLKMEPLAATAAEARARARGDELKGAAGTVKPPPGGAGGGKGKSEAEREAEALKKRGEALAASVDPLQAYNQKLAEYTELLNKAAISDMTFSRAVEKAKEELTSVNDTMRAALDPAFAYGQEMERLDRLYQQQIITLETLQLATEAASKKYQEFLDSQKEKTPLEKLEEDATQAVASGIGTFFTDIITGTKTAADAFKVMVESIIKNLAKLLAEFAAAEAAKFIIKSLFGGTSAGGKSGSGSTFAAPASLTLASRPASWSASRSLGVSPLVGAPGAAGGLVGAAAGASGSPWNVTINNNAPGVDVMTSARNDGGLEVTIEKVRGMLAQDVLRGGNSFSRSLESAYSLGRGR